jgi:hypothetical protein
MSTAVFAVSVGSISGSEWRRTEGGWPAASTLVLLGTKGSVMAGQPKAEGRNCGSEFLVGVYLLPLLVLALVITFLLIQRARRRRDTWQ